MVHKGFIKSFSMPDSHELVQCFNQTEQSLSIFPVQVQLLKYIYASLLT